MRRFFAIGAFIGAILVGMFVLAALWVQFLWNSLAADVFGAPELSFIKALLMVAAITTVRAFAGTTRFSVKR